MIPYSFVPQGKDESPVITDIPPADVFEPAPLPPLADAAQFPFPLLAPERARQALAAFHDMRRAPRVGIDQETGLPSFLYGDLAEPVSGDLLKASAEFLAAHELMLAGSEGEAVVEPARVFRWRQGTTQLEWRQTNSQGVPVYGSAVTLTYTGRRLTFLANALHSASLYQLDTFTWDEAWPERLREVSGGQARSPKSLAGQLSDGLSFVRFEPPRDLRRESAEKGWWADRWILPLLPADPGALGRMAASGWTSEPEWLALSGAGVYRPAWRTVGVDRSGMRWLLLVDAETYQVLTAEPTWVGASLEALLYRTAAEAAADTPAPEILDFGAGPDIAHADYVTLSGARMADPAAAVSGEPAELTARRVLTATAFYQARQAQTALRSALATLLLETAVTLPPAAANDPTLALNVSLDDEEASARYDFHTNTVHLGRGTPASSSSSPPVPAVHDPGFDGDVMAHESSHAITRFLKHVAFEYQNNNDWKQVLTQALDEGVAFYFGCCLAGDARWAEYAYADWGNLRDLGGSLATSSAPVDPAGITYQVGMWWARVFWALRQDPAINADLLILKAIAGLAGPLTSQTVMFHALLDPSEQYGPLLNVSAVLKQTGIPF